MHRNAAKSSIEVVSMKTIHKQRKRGKDGSVKEYAESKSVIEIAADISEGLARAATAGEVNGEVVDLRTVVSDDCTLSILTFNDEEGKGAFRHTASHILAQAIKRLYPDTKLAIGPSVADGFYYDIDRETPLTAEDLEKIEAERKKVNLIKQNSLKIFRKTQKLVSTLRENLPIFVQDHIL